MKKSALFCVATSLTILVLSADCSKKGNDEKRNLATPLSRLVGHWKQSSDIIDIEFYFSKAEKKEDQILGNYVAVFSPDPRNKDFAGKTVFLEYEILSEDITGDKLEIIRENPKNKGDESAALRGILYISKDGKQIKSEIIIPFVGEVEEKAPFFYVDSKTSPEDKK